MTSFFVSDKVKLTECAISVTVPWQYSAKGVLRTEWTIALTELYFSWIDLSLR